MLNKIIESPFNPLSVILTPFLLPIFFKKPNKVLSLGDWELRGSDFTLLLEVLELQVSHGRQMCSLKIRIKVCDC